MDSTQQQKSAEHRQHLHGAAAIQRLRDTVQESPNCFFCTHAGPGQPTDTRPMNVRQVDEAGNFWFLSSSDSLKNAELASDSTVELFFQGSDQSGFLHVTGHATVSRDREKIRELWEPILKTWFTGGVDDPRITVIRVTPGDGYYWDNQHGDMVAGIKILIGAATGRTLDDSVEGRVKPH